METPKIFSTRHHREPTRRARLSLIACATLTAVVGQAPAATKYFDSAAGAGNGVGGSGTLAAQSTALFSTTSAGDATLVAAAATDDGVFQGTAGTVTLSVSPYTLNSATFNTTGYVLTTSSTTARVFTTPITLGANINLALLDAAQTADRTLGIGSVSGGTGATLTIQGAQANGGTTASARVNLAVTGANVSVPTTISGTGTSIAGYVATATGTSITNTIANNSTFTTLLGATSGNDLTLSSAAVISGTAGVQFSAGTSGGAGLVTINSANTYTGATTLNNSTTGVIRLGVDNALPTGTALQFGIGTNNTGALDLNGHAQTVASLAVTGTGTINGIVNTATTQATLTVNGSASTTYSSTIGVPASTTNVPAANNNLALVKAGTGTLTLSGTSTYTGNTNVNAGTLLVSGSLNGNGITVNVNNGGALTLNVATALNDFSTLNLVSGATLNLSAAPGTSETIGLLNLDGTSIAPGTYAVGTLMGDDGGITFNSTNAETLTVTGVPEPATVLGGVLLVGVFGWSQRRWWRGLRAERRLAA